MKRSRMAVTFAALAAAAATLADVASADEHGRQRYEIRDGRHRVDVAGEPLEIAVYRLGGRYLAARSNEFGYANYEIEPGED